MTTCLAIRGSAAKSSAISSMSAAPERTSTLRSAWPTPRYVALRGSPRVVDTFMGSTAVKAHRARTPIKRAFAGRSASRTPSHACGPSRRARESLHRRRGRPAPPLVPLRSASTALILPIRRRTNHAEPTTTATKPAATRTGTTAPPAVVGGVPRYTVVGASRDEASGWDSA